MDDATKFTNIALQTFAAIVELIIVIHLKTAADRTDKLNIKCARLLICSACSLSLNAVSLVFRGGVTPIDFFAVRAVSLIEYCSNYLLAALFIDYLVSFIAMRNKISKNYIYVSYILAGIAVILVVVSQFSDMYYFFIDNVYQRGRIFWLSSTIPFMIMTIGIYIVLRHRKTLRLNEIACFFLYAFAPCIAMFLQFLFYGFALLTITTAVAIITIYVNIQTQQARLLKQQELELTNARINVMLSQIQPHFLYNSLVVIRHLCKTNPKLAEETVVEFADYLRGNLESLAEKKLINFEQELHHVETYLNIEKKRFGDKLRIKYDIKVKDFRIPALTLQPTVENAVRYGITKKEHGGTVEIKTEEAENCFIVTVTDDGVGFDVNKKIEDKERSHIGIENTRNRLASMCGGTLEIQSKIGEGTTAIIRIPK